MRQDLMYVHPDDFDKALEFFKYCFEMWTVGYEQWGEESFQAIFVKDPSVKRGVIYYCPYGELELVQPVAIPKSDIDFG